jgi:hypothetical protein
MGIDSDSSEFEKMSTKKLAVLFGLAFFGAFMVIQMIQGFPLAGLFMRQTVTEEVKVSLKNGDVCVVEPSDRQPKDIHDCSYSKGDTLIVTYYQNNTNLESYRLK